MSGYLPAAAGTVLVVRLAKTGAWRRFPILAWEPLERSEGEWILGPVVAGGGPTGDPWSYAWHDPAEKVDARIVVEADDRCVCPTPASTADDPLACTSCGRHLRERWTESPPR